MNFVRNMTRYKQLPSSRERGKKDLVIVLEIFKEDVDKIFL